MRLVVVAIVIAGCGFRVPSATPSDAAPDGGLPVSPQVHFVSVTTDTAMLRPGLYGIRVTAVLRNDLATDITTVGVSLAFADGTADRSRDFRWRDLDRRDGVTAPQPTTIAADSEATYRFSVDALASAVPPGPIRIDGTATFLSAGMKLAAAPLDPPTTVPFAAIQPTIVVDTATDQVTGAGTSFRQAIAIANARGGINRITFGTAVKRYQLNEALGELPGFSGADVVIDGTGASFSIATDQTWETPEGRYGLRVSGGRVVVANIGFHDLAYNYRNEGDLSGNNCGASGAQLEGGAIKVTGGTLILDGNTFDDPDVGERNCYAASLRIHGGTDHRILGNRWTDQVMDSMFIAAATVEVSNNIMLPGADPTKDDECVYVDSQGGRDLWVTGNVCTDMEYSGVIARGVDAGTLYVVGNTFVRDGRVGLSGVRREEATRMVVLRDNVYIGDAPSAILTDGGGGGFDIAYESVTGSQTCVVANCGIATFDAGSMMTPANAMLANEHGTTFADFTPAAGSPLIDSGIDWIDRNGTRPGRFDGAGPDRGALEAK